MVRATLIAALVALVAAAQALDREGLCSRVAGLPYHTMPRLAGTSVTWEEHAFPGGTAFAAELPAGQPSPGAVHRHVRAALAAARTR